LARFFTETGFFMGEIIAFERVFILAQLDPILLSSDRQSTTRGWGLNVTGPDRLVRGSPRPR